jgi:hypothetical protein
VEVPAALIVNVTEQEPVADNVQLGVLNVPVAPVLVKLTVPEGVVAPAPLVSVTVAVQFEACPMVTDEGLQTTLVEVVRRVPVTVPLVAPLLVLAP